MIVHTKVITGNAFTMSGLVKQDRLAVETTRAGRALRSHPSSSGCGVLRIGSSPWAVPRGDPPKITGRLALPLLFSFSAVAWESNCWKRYCVGRLVVSSLHQSSVEVEMRCMKLLLTPPITFIHTFLKPFLTT